MAPGQLDFKDYDDVFYLFFSVPVIVAFIFFNLLFVLDILKTCTAVNVYKRQTLLRATYKLVKFN